MIRKYLVSYLLFLLFVTVGFSQAIPKLVSQQGYADTIIVNGKIVSMDDRSIVPDTPGHIYQAMAIKGKRVMALGNEAEIRQLAWHNTQVLDVGGKTVIPGLVQTHYHTFTSAGAMHGPKVGLLDPSVKLTVEAESTPEATAKKLRDVLVNAIETRSISEGTWITVSLNESRENPPGTARTWLYLGRLNKRQIDGVTPSHPVLVTTRLQGIFNSAAVSELSAVFPDWEESTDLENRPGAGNDGYAAVPEIHGMSWEYWWRNEPIDKLAETLWLRGQDVIAEGITTVATRILFPRVVAAYHHLNREDRLPHRLAYYIESQRGNFWNLKSIHEFYKGYGAPWTSHSSGGEMMWLNGMCNEIWDSIYNEVCLGPDMPNAPADIKARERCPAPGTKPWESYKEAIVHGWRPVQGHATSSHGARLYVQMLEQAMEEGGYSEEYIRSLRTTIEHNILLGNVPDVMEGIKKYGIIINVNMGMLAGVPQNIKDYGEELESFAMPVKTWINDGVRVTFEASGTDFWTPIHTLITRQVQLRPEIGGAESDVPLGKVVLLPEEGVDRVTALKMATTWASEYMLAEDTIGTLEPGKYADFAVLDKDFFSIPVNEIPNLEVIATGLSGEVVYGQDQLNSGN
ncbi:MAG: amidohydrolase family protein [Acidobacteriota bacterium]|nr:amidohydrolase family protein [Acidobacteriota bacterium]